MTLYMSRRHFLKLGAFSLVGLAIGPGPGFKDDLSLDTGEIIRIASSSVSVYTKPSDKSLIRFQRYRDEIVHVYEEVISPQGPAYNPLWYRVWGGYIHSSYVQLVRYQLNSPLSAVPEKGLLAEVSVPVSQAMRYNSFTGWSPLYRLYYQSTHWINGIDQGPDGEGWYRIYDELLRSEYFIPARHMRIVSPDELTPISPQVPPDQKRINVSLARQYLVAYEGDRIVLETRISSGIPSRGSDPASNTETPRGTFNIQSKMPSKHMGNGELTSDPEAYEYPGVPWTSFFEPVMGIAFHGTYWHTNYGVTMSHGCINMRCEEAKWLFRWTTPEAAGDEIEKRGMGTLVVVS